MSEADRPQTTEILPELLELRLDGAMVDKLEHLIAQVEPLLDWRQFGRIPCTPSHAGPVRFVRDLWRTEVLRRYSFLSYATTHELQMRLLRLRHRHPQANRLYRFLCMNEWVDESELPPLSAGDIDCYVRSGLFVRRGRRLMLALSVVPYGDAFYVVEARHVKENKALYGIAGAHICHDTHVQVEYLKNRLAHRPHDHGHPVDRRGRRRAFSRMLEMGCGVGIVSLEMRDHILEREGAELDPRNLAFAGMNQRLRRDHHVRFYRSDLFASVGGRFDFILFNPWHPSEDNLELALRFLRESPDYLTPDGEMMLTTGSRCIMGKDAVMLAIAETLRAAGLMAERDIIASHFVDCPCGSRILTATSFYWITRDHGGRPSQPTVHTRWDASRAVFEARRELKQRRLRTAWCEREIGRRLG